MINSHSDWNLSRACIRDTIMAKRDGLFRPEHQHALKNLAIGCYKINIKSLRETQLAPHQEKMIAGRFLAMMNDKLVAPDIVIIMRGGMIQEVKSTNKYTRVYVADHDIHNKGPDEDELSAHDDAVERSMKPDMSVVY